MLALDRQTTAILPQEGFDEHGQPLNSRPSWFHEAAVLPPEQVTEALERCELTVDARTEVERNPVLYEEPARSVNISIDDVVVKQQKSHRCRLEEEEGEETTGRTYVHHTVAHVQHEEQSYCFTGQGVSSVLRMLLGYLLTHALVGRRLQFFVDGQKTLHAAILCAFTWFRNVGLLLDWYHLHDKCARQLSLAMKGATVRHDALMELSTWLWYGRVDSATVFLRSLPRDHLKQPDEIRGLIGYLERNRAYLPCYEIRKRFGLRNSSQRGEKMNDLLVSHRQKHQGMSWSVKGSSAVAALEMLKQNHEYQHWFEDHEIAFKQAA